MSAEISPEGPADSPADAPERAPSDLEIRLREAGSEELLALVREHVASLEAQSARGVLRNPYVTVEIVELIAGQPRLVSFYEVRRELAVCARAPEALALRMIPGLYWRDLVALGADTRLHPRLRRAAEQSLIPRLASLAVGEKISIARRASAGLLAQLRHDPSPRVIAALLDNPRLTEDILAPVAHGAATPGPVLALIAADRRWGARYALQAALSRNPGTPLSTSLRLLPLLRKAELKAVANDPRVPEPVRGRARVLLGEAP